MRNLTIIFALSAMLLGGACSDHETNVATSGGDTQATAAQPNLSPEDLGELGARIGKNPADAERLLSERGLNEQTFEQAVRKVSEDPAASKRYAEAYKRASA